MKSENGIEFTAYTGSDSTLEGELGLVERFQVREIHAHARREFERWLKRAKLRLKGCLNAHLSLTIADRAMQMVFKSSKRTSEK